MLKTGVMSSLREEAIGTSGWSSTWRSPKASSYSLPRRFKLVSIVYTVVFILISQELVAADDEYLQALREKVGMVKKSLGETVKSLEAAVQESESGSESPRSDAEPIEQSTPPQRASPPEQAAPPKQASAEAVKPVVARALFTAGVRNYEPINALTELKQQRKMLFFYTELLGMTNRQLQHRWYFYDREVSVIPIVPQELRWRVVSQVQLEDRYGPWAAELVNEENEVMVRREILYQPEKPVQQ